MRKLWSRYQHYFVLFGLWLAVVGIGIMGAALEWWQDRNQPVFVAPAQETNRPLIREALWLPNTASAPAYTASQVWLYDRQNNVLLYEDNAREATSVASLSKIMTALVSYEAYSLEDSIQIATASQAIGNRAKFLSRDVFSVYDLLHALLIFSANDAAEALAAAYPGGTDSFVLAMNQKADQLDLSQTSFENPSGLDASEQLSSAQDVGLITLSLLDVPFLSEVVSKPVAQIREQRTGRVDTVYTTNALLYRDPRYRGVKTGTTQRAGESLVVRFAGLEDSATLASSPAAELAVERDLILVLLGSQDRFADAQALISWARERLLQ